MFDLLETYLSAKVSVEKMAAYKAAYKIFERIELPQYEQILEELVMDEFGGTVDEGVTVNRIHDFFLDALSFCLKEHGILVNDFADIEYRTLLVNAILDLPDYEGRSDIIQTLSQDLNPEETFSELMSLITTKTADDVLSKIESVEPLLFVKLKQLVLEAHEEPSHVLSIEEKQKRVDGFKIFLAYVQNYDLHISKMLESGMDVGFPFATYAFRISDILDELEPIQAAMELYGMAVVSEEGFVNPKETALANIDNYISSIESITAISLNLTQLSQRLLK